MTKAIEGLRLTPEQQALVEKNIRLAPLFIYHYKLSRRLFRYHREDALQAAYLGLCRAAATFDPSKAKFTTHAFLHMRNQIQIAAVTLVGIGIPGNRARARLGFRVPLRLMDTDFLAVKATVEADDDSERISGVELRRRLRMLSPREREAVFLMLRGVPRLEIGPMMGRGKPWGWQVTNSAIRRLSGEKRPHRPPRRGVAEPKRELAAA